MKWKKILGIVLGIAIAAYMAFAMLTLSKPDDSVTCTGVHVNIEQTAMTGFLTEADVRQILSEGHLSPVGVSLNSIDLHHIEEVLQGKELIDKAECYLTRDGVMMVDIKQRVPVVRVINSRGDDYYVDTDGRPMPHANYSCNLIVATGAISQRYAQEKLAPMVNLIQADPFWKAQVEQLNVLPDGSVEMVPRVGSHIVYLGQPTGIAKKLERLRKFYLYGLNVAGWNKYSYISVEFDNQIICKKKPKRRA